MPRIQYLESAQADFGEIARYISKQSGSAAVARQFVKTLRQKCRDLATLPGAMGRLRSELGPDLRSVAYRGYIIYFRYVNDRFQVVNILEGHRDAEKLFGMDAETGDDG
ncbi:plasmid stabilization system protein ParE [Neorhizobium sp. 2083]|uniref:type II toxin-antitoxin system RelE/ParE family toxin n=1 Tax=Neorhizobium sp. 2083 TaxID=2817762 RepID=UPI002866F4B0|nr:type II toxin-antitoxin system RelE/ParE family toxin [Neorhizobium sp. 2083]MDR6815425.1 plasmid stabilization system protein ParE [Neorhizobium sp. 2083]